MHSSPRYSPAPLSMITTTIAALLTATGITACSHGTAPLPEVPATSIGDASSEEDASNVETVQPSGKPATETAAEPEQTQTMELSERAILEWVAHELASNGILGLADLMYSMDGRGYFQACPLYLNPNVTGAYCETFFFFTGESLEGDIDAAQRMNEPGQVEAQYRLEDVFPTTTLEANLEAMLLARTRAEVDAAQYSHVVLPRGKITGAGDDIIYWLDSASATGTMTETGCEIAMIATTTFLPGGDFDASDPYAGLLADPQEYEVTQGGVACEPTSSFRRNR